jgi:hypothetical protein
MRKRHVIENRGWKQGYLIDIPRQKALAHPPIESNGAPPVHLKSQFVDGLLEQLKAESHVASQIYISADPAELEALAQRLANNAVDCVTIGGGVTRPVKNAELLEALLNIIAGTNPAPRIALVLGPENAPAAVKRVLR